MWEWLTKALQSPEHAGIAGLGSLVAIVVGGVYTGIVQAKRKLKAMEDAYEKGRPPMPSDPKLPPIPVDEEPVAFWRGRTSALLERIRLMEDAQREAAKLADMRERALEDAVRELKADVAKLDGIVVAQVYDLERWKKLAASANAERERLQASIDATHHDRTSDAPPPPLRVQTGPVVEVDATRTLPPGRGR